MSNKTMNLSRRELEVMEALWSVDRPIVASEIPKINPDLSINTVTVLIKKLVKRELVCVDNIVYSGTVLSRSYKTTMSAREYAIKQFYENSGLADCSASKISIVATLLEDEEGKKEFIKELELLIADHKKNSK